MPQFNPVKLKLSTKKVYVYSQYNSLARPVYTPSQDTGAWSGETEEEAPITYVFSEQENPWTVLDTGHLYKRVGEQEEEEE